MTVTYLKYHTFTWLHVVSGHMSAKHKYNKTRIKTTMQRRYTKLKNRHGSS